MKPLYTAQERPKTKAFTDTELVAKLKAIRDSAITWLQDCIDMKNTAGSSTAIQAFKSAQDELFRIADRKEDKKTSTVSGKIELVFQKKDDKEPLAPDKAN